MADFTQEQLEEIRDEFRRTNPGGKYTDDFGTVLDGIAAFEAYLQAQRQHFQKKFADEKAEREKQEQSERENAEKELEVYLQSVYVEEKSGSEDITQETWQSRGYAEWRDNYAANHPNDSYYSELKERVDSLSKNTKFKQAEVKEVKSPEENAAKVFTLDDVERYLIWQEEYLNRENADKEFEQLHENAQADLRDFVAGKLEIEPAAYDKMEEFIQIFADGYKANEMKKLFADAKAKLTELNEEAKKQKLSSIVEGLGRNAAAREEQAAITPGVVPPTNTLNMREDMDKQQGLKHDERVAEERIRSANSDANEFLLDRVKLDVLLEMNVISQEIHDAGIKDPAAAIEKLNSSRPLNEQETIEFENRMADKMLNNEQLFELLPPKMLADLYQDYNQKIVAVYNQQGEQADVSAEQAVVNKLAARMDELSRDLYDKQNLYFADITNISDTYDGYMRMFDVREGYATEKEKQVVKPIHDSNRSVLTEIISQYDKEWNLDKVQENDAEKLNDRFDTLSAVLAQTELNEKTAKLVSNFKFLDAEGKIEPQFINEKNEQSDVWQPGSRIIDGSKLDTFVQIARYNVLMSQLGSAEEPKAENLNAEVGDELQSVLYAAHVANQVEKGVNENPAQFTDKKYRDQFIADLANIERPMSVSPTAYEAAVDSQINSVGAFAHRLGSKIGKDKPIVAKLFEPLKNLDKRAGDRTSTTVDKWAIRLELLQRTGKLGTSALLVSGAITVAATATAAAADASLTAATLGMNKYAGIAVSSALAVGMTIRQIRRWRKERKEAGQKRGLGALVKDRRMLMTIGTTALGAAAVGFAATGNPGVAKVLGYSSLALGSANGIINSYEDITKAGLGKSEAAAWAVFQTGVTVGAGFLAREVANYFIDMYNAHHPDNDIFQHKKTTQVEEEITVPEKVQVVDVERLNQNAENFLSRTWYSQHPEQLTELIAQYGSAEKVLYMIDAGGIMTPGGELMIDGTISNGNHTVLTHSWAEQNGVSADAIDTLRHPSARTPEQIDAAIKEIRGHVDTERNFVSRIENAPTEHRLYAGRDPESTYSHDKNIPTREIEVPKTKTVVKDVPKMFRNETDLGLGMFGVLGHKIKGITKLKDRIGAFADKIRGKKNISGTAVAETEKEQKNLVEHKRAQYSELSISEMLDKEYKIVHGIEPDKLERIRYSKLVQKEMAADAMGTTDLGAYLQKRKDKFEDTLKTNVAPNDEAKGFADTEAGKEYINAIRETMWKTNLSADGKPLESKDVTLLHFEKLVGIGENNAKHARVKAAEDRGRTPAAPGKAGRPHGGTYDVTAVTSGKNRASR